MRREDTMPDVMGAYEVRVFDAPLRSGTSVTHDVYERGEGSPVVLIQELPGIGPETLALADKLVGAGHRVVLPHLFGPLGKISTARNLARVICMRREFHIWTRNESIPVVDWLGALCRDVRERTGVKGVGVIGMCLTGNFAIALMADDSVLAAVAAEPSLPLAPQTSLHMSETQVDGARRRLDAVGPMLALRFEGDRLCTAAKFETINAAFNGGSERVRLVTLPGPGHAVLTRDFVDEEGHPTRQALQAVLDYFAEKLAA
jgi:dienelactone hydrolase